MTQNKFTFKSQELAVDWITFNFASLYLVDLENSNNTIFLIAEYFFKMGFNCFQKLNRKTEEPILYNSENEFKVSFIQSNDWKGVNLTFSGVNSEIFYQLIKTKTINWEFFSSATLSRFDICYSRELKKTDKISVKTFLHECENKASQTNRNSNLGKNNKGNLFSAGHRKSKKFYRIYKKDNTLRFEQEIKSLDYSSLVSEDFEQFENSLSKGFIKGWAKILPLHFSYLDWLVYQLRSIKDQKFEASFKADYIQSTGFLETAQRKDFFNLLYFLNYSQYLDYEIDSLGSTRYRKVTFQVKHFLNYKNESNNYYQLKKVLQFFGELQANSLIKYFTDKKYRSLVTIPEVILKKKKQNSWFAEIWIAEELFCYAHPFLFPDLLKSKLTKHQFEVQFKFIQTFSSLNTEKIFNIEKFFNNFPATLNGRQKSEIKKYFIQLVHLFKEHNLIEDNYKIISQNMNLEVEELSSKNVSEGFIIYEKLQ